VNIFDNLPSFVPKRSRATFDEIQLYLSTETEDFWIDPIRWWHEKRKTYPRLYRMALDYLTISRYASNFYVLVFHDNIILSATSVDVERLFSHGRLILSHTRSHLSVLSTRAFLCLGSWSLLELVRDEDVHAVGKLDDIKGRIKLEQLAETLKNRSYI
jgi:hypothetical protein